MLPFRSGRVRRWSAVVSLLSIFLWLIFASAGPALAGKSKAGKKKKQTLATSATSPPAGEQSLTNIPLPIGHEAKALVLPDSDPDAHLRAKFLPDTAARIDQAQ